MKCCLLLMLFATQARAPDRKLQGLAEQCGTEIPWVTSLEEAQALSKESGKPIAWWVTTVAGTKMDRKLVIQKYMLSGPFMMPRVVDLLSSRFVPLRLAGKGAHRKEFGVAPFKFIEPGLVFLDADLKVLHKTDRITTFSEEWFAHLLNGVLRKAGQQVDDKKVPLDPARQAIADGKPDPALFEKLEGDEARYFHGVALHLVGRDEAGRAEWRKIQEGRWAWKAAAELDRDGPFVRGFEIYESLPPEALAEELPSNTTVACKSALVKRAVRYLIQTQRGSGRWDDSHYNFGGEDSLPNVYMAVTALAAVALREWGDPKQIQTTIERAEKYMRDESNIAVKDRDEIVWAHAYRLLYFAATKDKEMMERLVALLGKLQIKKGAWYHEYPAPFTTASVLLALDEARKAGAEVPEDMIARGGEALKSCRTARGVYSYGYPGRGGSVQNAAGRMPLCEAALLTAGLSDADSVKAALEVSFKHHDLLEKIRKYDDHADRYGNGGFFFWYDQHGRAVAARSAGAAEALARQKEIVLAIAEIDGCWVDSHELGRVYGTAMGLLTLKLCE
ncbi:MAG: hypothetical protein HY716_12740 [Planctomycetes bacterium]|nr:hypothetical protein [Planctomycetota bacterium]